MESQIKNIGKSIYKGPNSVINGDTIDGNMEAIQNHPFWQIYEW